MAVVTRSRGVAKQLNQGVTHLMKKNKITVVTGIVFMICVLLFRRGIVGELADTRLGRMLGLR